MTEEDILSGAAEIRDETQPAANSAVRVGEFLLNLAQFVIDRTKYTKVTSTSSIIGGMAAGTQLAGKSHNDLWELAAAAAYKGAVLSLSAVPALWEKGTAIGITATGSVVPNSDTITSRRLKRNGTTISSPVTNSVNFVDAGVTAEAIYTLEADVQGGGTKTSPAVTVKPVAPTFFGAVGSATPTEAQIRGLTKQLWTAGSRSVTINCAGNYPAFSEPQTNGTRAVIKDKNGFPITTDVSRTELIVQLADHTVQVPSTEKHWLYVHKNPQTDSAFAFSL